MSIDLLQSRIDYFLIWGNGLPYRNEIIDIIRNCENLKFLAMVKHYPRSIKRLVKAVYSYDYAPSHHIKSKTKYLQSTKKEVVFIFVKNLDYREINIGSGVFRHTESPTIRDIKELIRNTYNEKKDNKRDENHVVHASDNISQTDSILKYLGSKDSIEHFLRNDNTVFPVPYHIEEVKNYCIKNIDMSRVMCNIIMSPNRTKVIPIQETPHYSLLTGEYHLYEEYLNKYGGLLLKDDYSIEKFLKLSKTMKYLDPPYESNYILLKKRRDGVFQVLDGVHRTCILKYNGYENFIGALLQT